MALLTERQVKEHDVDWYCLVQGMPTHISSIEGSIPELFRDRGKLRKQQDSISQIEPFTEVRLNIDEIRRQTEEGYEYLQDTEIREYIENAIINQPGFVHLREYDLAARLFASSFVEKSRRGFRSFARVEGRRNNMYVLIAEPLLPINPDFANLELETLDCEILNDGKVIMIA